MTDQPDNLVLAFEEGPAGVYRRLDRLGYPVERIERRLEITEAH